MPIEFETQDKLQYRFVPNNTGFVQFRVRANNDAHIALTTGAAECNPMYEIFLGGWGNTRSIIRKNRAKPDVATAETHGILDPNQHRGFWIRWENGQITVGHERGPEFLRFDDSERLPICFVGFCTGWGSSGAWIIDEAGQSSYQGGGGGFAPGVPAPYTQHGSGGANIGNACWVGASGGQIPPRAFVGGEDNGEPMFVARASFSGALIPGKLLQSHGCAYVPWGGKENGVSNYEVLCDCNASWISCRGGNIPPNAVAAGQTEEGEPLYVGRTGHNGSLTTGKVQRSHGVLYIPYGGEELSFPEFEILVQ